MWGRKPKLQRSSMQQALIDFAEETAMLNHGWRFWPANATQEEIQAAVERYIKNGEHHWYAPGQIEEPIITEGKLVIKETSNEC